LPVGACCLAVAGAVGAALVDVSGGCTIDSLANNNKKGHQEGWSAPLMASDDLL